MTPIWGSANVQATHNTKRNKSEFNRLATYLGIYLAKNKIVLYLWVLYFRADFQNFVNQKCNKIFQCYYFQYT